MSNSGPRSHCKPNCLVGQSSSSLRLRQGSTARHFFNSPAPEPPAPAFNPAAQTGAIAPLGYFDPLEICKEGDEAKFLQMRAYEIKWQSGNDGISRPVGRSLCWQWTW